MLATAVLVIWFLLGLVAVRLFSFTPGQLAVGLQVAAVEFWSATEILRHRLDQIDLGYLALYYVIAAAVFLDRGESEIEVEEREHLQRSGLRAGLFAELFLKGRSRWRERFRGVHAV